MFVQCGLWGLPNEKCGNGAVKWARARAHARVRAEPEEDLPGHTASCSFLPKAYFAFLS